MTTALDAGGGMDREQRDMMKALGARMAMIRRSRRMTQDQVAERADIDVQALRRAEGGRSALPLHRLQRVATALQTDLPNLMQFDAPVPKPVADPDQESLLAAFRALPKGRRIWAVRCVEALRDPK